MEPAAVKNCCCVEPRGMASRQQGASPFCLLQPCSLRQALHLDRLTESHGRSRNELRRVPCSALQSTEGWVWSRETRASLTQHSQCPVTWLPKCLLLRSFSHQIVIKFLKVPDLMLSPGHSREQAGQSPHPQGACDLGEGGRWSRQK